MSFKRIYRYKLSPLKLYVNFNNDTNCYCLTKCAFFWISMLMHVLTINTATLWQWCWPWTCQDKAHKNKYGIVNIKTKKPQMKIWKSVVLTLTESSYQCCSNYNTRQCNWNTKWVIFFQTYHILVLGLTFDFGLGRNLQPFTTFYCNGCYQHGQLGARTASGRAFIIQAPTEAWSKY